LPTPKTGLTRKENPGIPLPGFSSWAIGMGEFSICLRHQTASIGDRPG
jgi:hypothetical protein